jgi:Chaperone of endosialidase/Domain of unknown function (DUF5011)
VQQGSGNVGIGTTNPATTLDIDGSAAVAYGSSYGGKISSGSYYSGAGFYPFASNIGANDTVIQYASGSNNFVLEHGTSSVLVANSSGNVGIGTTDPGGRLTVVGPSGVTSFTGGSNLGLVVSGSGANNDFSGIDLSGTGDINEPLGRIALLSTGNGSDLYFGTSDDYGNGITTTPLILDYDGNATVHGCLNYNGGTSGTCLSDERLKSNVNDFTDGLSTIVGLNPVTYQYNGLAGTPNDVATGEVRTGLIAQQVQQVAPDLIATTTGQLNGATTTLYEVNYNALTFALINAVKQIASISDEFEQNLIAWLGNAQNGIQDLFANRVIANQLCAETSSGTPVCVTGDQLAALLSAQNANASPESVTSATDSNSSPNSTESASSTVPNPSPGSAATDTPPEIEINGDNPASIEVGATYNDLGATITGPQADLNLGIETYLNGSPMSPIEIDTSEPATDTIDYVATDQSGLTATTTRIVIIEAPSITPADAATSTDATTTDDDAATTTDATSTDQ